MKASSSRRLSLTLVPRMRIQFSSSYRCVRISLSLSRFGLCIYTHTHKLGSFQMNFSSPRGIFLRSISERFCDVSAVRGARRRPLISLSAQSIRLLINSRKVSPRVSWPIVCEIIPQLILSKVETLFYSFLALTYTLFVP